MRWIDAPPPPHEPLPGYSPLLGRLLARRGLITPQAAEAFLYLSHYHPSPPEALPSLTNALERIEQAIRKHEPICIWGDFNVDGQTSTAILVQTLRALEANLCYHVTSRFREGHNIPIPYLDEQLHRGTKLLITCGIGVNEHLALERARQQGVEVILVDHHDLPSMVPPADALLSPKLLPADHPLATLSASGLAYKLAEALLQRHQSALAPQALLDLTAIGLIAASVPLRGEARYLVQCGLPILRATPRPGLQILYELAQIEPGLLNESHVAFTLAPRLNSLGRLLDANPAIEFLLTQDSVRAGVLATQIENAHAQYQLLTDQVLQAAEEQLRLDPELSRAPVLILGHSTWSNAVLNAVAARLAERYGKPAIVLQIPAEGPARGSARSVEGLNLSAALAAHADLLLKFGGHPMAASLALESKNLPAFRRRMNKTIQEMQLSDQAEATLEIEAWLSLSDITQELAAEIEQLAPFGVGNPRPVFATRRLTLESSVALGRNKEHRRLTVSDEEGRMTTVLWWNGGQTDLPEAPFDLAFTLRMNERRGIRQVHLELVDLHLAEATLRQTQAKRPAIHDLRQEATPYHFVSQWRNDPETLIWAEGEEKALVGGVDRFSLQHVRHLVIWTIPPSGEILRTALEAVRPERITLVCVGPTIENTENFVARFGGLLKHILNQRQGRTSYAQLAAATAHRLETVQTALAWFAAQGKISLRRDDQGELLLAFGNASNTIPTSKQLWLELQSLLAETAAYRSYVRRAPVESLFPEE